MVHLGGSVAAKSCVLSSGNFPAGLDFIRPMPCGMRLKSPIRSLWPAQAGFIQFSLL
jgi:hypothetical protein